MERRRERTQVSDRVSRTFDVVVIGGGSAGIAAIEGAKAAGAKSICLIEMENFLGGECTHWACVPTKAMLKAAKLYHIAKFSAGRYGVQTGKVTFDFAAMLHRRDAVVHTLTGNGKRLAEFAKALKVTVKHGPAHFVGTHVIDVKGERVRGQAFVIATGSREREPVIDGLENVPVWYSRDVVSMKHLPGSIAILGGGPVGCEFATLFGLLGVRTTVLEAGEHILPREDLEIATLAESKLRDVGVQVHTKTRPLGLKREGRNCKVTFQVGRKPRQHVMVNKVIVAVGRQANIDTLALDRAQIAVDDGGALKLESNLQTSQAHVFAAGDVAGGYLFTHTAAREGYTAGWNAAQIKLGGKPMKLEEKVVPRVTFVDPEVASVGLTVAAATRAKKVFKIMRFPFSALGRAAIDGSRDGLLKVLVDKKTGLILGAHITGERAGEIVHELALAMQAEIPFAQVQSMLHAYPSWSEVIPAAE